MSQLGCVASCRYLEVNSAWAFATLREVDGQLFRALEERCLSGSGCLLVDATPQQLANLTWAFATVGHGSEGELFELVAREARPKLGDFSMQGIANLVWAFATAGVDATELFQAVGDKLMSDGGRLLDRSPDAQIAFGVDLTAVLQSFRARGFTHPVMHWAQTEGLRQLGQHLDLTIVGSLSPAPRSLGTLPDMPEFVFNDEDRCVVLKPPGWQVDTEGDEEDFIEEAHSAREMLSGFMISTFSGMQLPILTDRRCKKGFLHRLDVPSSGLILAAKTYDAYFDLLGQLACGNISRDYVVMLHGFLAASRGIFQVSLDKDVGATWSAKSAVLESGGKASSTRLRVGGYVFAQQHQPLTIVAMRIDSGRRHQIRVQSAYAGHPTVTDRRYTVELVYDADARWCKRNFLHRFSLAFCDSEGAHQSARAALPTDLREVMWHVTPKE
ncbi:ylyB, partial [Symbiodinium sp. CCMP2456]